MSPARRRHSLSRERRGLCHSPARSPSIASTTAAKSFRDSCLAFSTRMSRANEFSICRFRLLWVMTQTCYERMPVWYLPEVRC